MELNAEVRLADMPDALIADIVGVVEDLFPVLGERIPYNSVAVVLGRNVASAREKIRAWNVMAAIAELHLDSFGASGECQQLMAQTDAEDGCF